MWRAFLLAGVLGVVEVGLSGGGEGSGQKADYAEPTPPVDQSNVPAPRTAKNGRHALLIGISNYRRGRPDYQDWWDLNATNDVDAMEQLLKDPFEFRPEEIVVLRDGQATRKGILAAFDELVRATQKNDVVYIHYSGHGQRVPDDTGEEIDGWAQSIIPFDYKSRADRSQNIVNREFRKLVADLKAKKPANITLVFDCCFAGEITKGGDELIRGEAWRGTPPKSPPTGRAKYAKGPIGLFPPKAAAAEGYVVLGASRYDLVAQQTPAEDGRKMGLLTYALIHALRDSRPPGGAESARATEKGTTYRDIFGRVNDIVTRRSRGRQSPQLEGEIDQVFLSGIVRRPSRFVEVSVPDSGLPITLEAGSLQGVTKGSLYAIYPEGTVDFAKAQPLAETTVENVRVGNSTLKLNGAGSNVKETDLHRGRAVERKHVFGDNRLKVDLRHLSLHHPQGQSLVEKIRKFDPVAPEDGGDSADLRVIRRAKDQVVDRTIVGLRQVPEGLPWVVVRRDGSVAAAYPEDERLANRIALLIEDEVRWRGIMGLRNAGLGDLFDIELRVVPVEVRLGANRFVEEVLRDKAIPLTEGNRLAYAEGEHVMIEVRVAKTAKFDPYVAVLDLLPNGEVSLLWPKGKKLAESKRVTADGRWHRFEYPFVWEIALPDKPRYGPGTYNPVDRGEVFKVFATQTYIPMHLLTDPPTARGLNVRGMELEKGGDLAELIRAAAGGSRADPRGVAPEYWSTATVVVDIIPKR
jgi:hypothetical protein